MAVRVVLNEDAPKNAKVIEAFPSRGYVSTLSTNHMIKQLDMRQIGHIECDKLDAIAVVHEGLPKHPIRIYAKDDIVVIFSELIVPFNLTHDFTLAIDEWFKILKPSSAIFLASIPGVESDKEHEILSVSTDPDVKPRIESLGIKRMDEGVLTGISSSLMLKCVNQNIPATSLMVETSYIPDVLAASSLLNILSKILDLDIKVDQLVKAGKQIESKFKVNMAQMSKGQQNYDELHQQSAMYR